MSPKSTVQRIEELEKTADALHARVASLEHILLHVIDAASKHPLARKYVRDLREVIECAQPQSSLSPSESTRSADGPTGKTQ